MTDGQVAIDEVTRSCEAAAQDAKKDTDCPLLKLPGEIRTNIYGYVIGEDKAFNKGLDHHEVFTYGGWREAPILQVCRQLRAEGVSFFYGSNTLILECRGFWLGSQDITTSSDSGKLIAPTPPALISIPRAVCRFARNLSIQCYFRYSTALRCNRCDGLGFVELAVVDNTYSCRGSFNHCGLPYCRRDLETATRAMRETLIEVFESKAACGDAPGSGDSPFRFEIDTRDDSPRYKGPRIYDIVIWA